MGCCGNSTRNTRQELDSLTELNKNSNSNLISAHRLRLRGQIIDFRQNLCNACPHKVKDVCRLCRWCDSVIEDKVKNLEDKCPISKW